MAPFLSRTPAHQRRSHRVPISLRLGAVFATLFLISITVVGTATYVQLERSLRAGLDSALVASSDEILDGLPNATDADERQVGDVASTEVESQVLAPDGTVLDASTGELRARSLLSPPQFAAVIQGQQLFADSTRGERRVRLLASRVDESGAAVLVVTTALDPVTRFRAAYLTSVTPLAVLATLLAGASGWFVARRALRPVAQMTRDAAVIGAGDLSHRLVLPPTEDEISRLGRTLNAMLERLHTAIVRERDFTADASHELRTPLAILRGEVERSLEAVDDPRVRVWLSSALQECDRLRDLTDDLLFMARAEADQVDGRVPTDLGDVADGVLSRFRTWCEQRDVDLSRSGDAVVSADPRSIDRALSNLVDNALRHVDKGGTVGVDIVDRGGIVEVAVDDDGPGINERDRVHLLSRFVRSDTSRNSHGTGLGLAIVSAVAAAHGGTVELEDSRLGGLRVVMRLDPGGRRVPRVDGVTAAGKALPTVQR